MALAPSITESQILTALRTFLLAVLPDGIECFKGQANRVAEPTANQFVMMTPLSRTRIETNTDTWDFTDPNVTTFNMLSPTQVTVQLDFHGEGSTDNCQTVMALFRDDYACQSFTDSGFDLQPLYTSDPVQAPFINGENQYEDRWTLDVVMQANPVLIPTQQYANAINVELIEIDVVYPPIPSQTILTESGVAIETESGFLINA